MKLKGRRKKHVLTHADDEAVEARGTIPMIADMSPPNVDERTSTMEGWLDDFDGDF